MKPKQFYYTTGAISYSRARGSSKIRAIIYGLTKEGLVHASFCDYNTASCRGVESEVLAKLVELNRLPSVKGYNPSYGYFYDYNGDKQRVILTELQTARYGDK